MNYCAPRTPPVLRRPWRAAICRLGRLSLIVLATLLARPLTAQEVPVAPPTEHLDSVFAGKTPPTADDLRAMEARVQDLVKRVMPATVNVRLGGVQGSGVVITSDGYVLTAAHVAGRPMKQVMLTFPDGRDVPGTTLGVYRSLDAGLIKLTTGEGEAEPSWPHVEMGDLAKIEPGSWCLALGHPGGMQPDRPPVARLGRVLVKDKRGLKTDCALMGGDSGGPLFDLEGRVIGIHSRIGSPLTENIHVPVSAYQEMWERLVAGEAWGRLPGSRPVIGVRMAEGATDATIGEVEPDSPAAQAGLQTGDRVLKFDGQDVATFAVLRQLVQKSEPGKKVALEILRGDEKMTFELEIGDDG